MTEGLTLERVVIREGGRVLVAIESHVAPGEILSVMGPSGSGKSTLLAAIVGALPPEFELAGRILVDGRDVTALPPERRRLGILFQDDLLFPHMSVGQNLAFGARPRSGDRRARIEAALDEIGLGGFADRDPSTLSGGQKARVALMRTLLSEPRALLLDEPFSRLDAALRAQMRRLVFSRAADLRLPVLMVTHDAEDARAAGGRTVLIGPGAAPDEAAAGSGAYRAGRTTPQ